MRQVRGKELLCSSLLTTKLQLQDSSKSASWYNHLICLSSILTLISLLHFIISSTITGLDWTGLDRQIRFRPLPPATSYPRWRFKPSPPNQRHSLIHTLIRHWVSGGSSFTIPLGQSVKHRDRCSRARQAGPSNSSVLGFNGVNGSAKTRTRVLAIHSQTGTRISSSRATDQTQLLATYRLARSLALSLPRILSWR